MKDTNPKDAIGIRKAPLSVVPMGVVAEVGIGMLEGTVKYGRHNYRAVGVRASVYFDATMRHLISWWEGEDLDPDSDADLHHITKAIASLMVLRDAQLQDKCEDDRPPKSKPFYKDLNERAAKVIEQHKDKKPHHYTDAGKNVAATTVMPQLTIREAFSLARKEWPDIFRKPVPAFDYEEEQAWTELTKKLAADNEPTTAPSGSLTNVSGVPYTVKLDPASWGGGGGVAHISLYPSEPTDDQFMAALDNCVQQPDDGECRSCVDGQCVIGPECVAYDNPLPVPLSIGDEDWSDYYQTARNNILAFNDKIINGKTVEAQMLLEQAIDCLDDLYSMWKQGRLMLYGKPVEFA